MSDGKIIGNVAAYFLVFASFTRWCHEKQKRKVLYKGCTRVKVVEKSFAAEFCSCTAEDKKNVKTVKLCWGSIDVGKKREKIKCVVKKPFEMSQEKNW